MTKTVYMVCTSCQDEMQRAVREIERLTRELAEARDLIAHAIGGSDEARLRERNAALEGALRLILPLAKGYSPENQSDSARHTCNSWVVAAEDVLNDPIQVEPAGEPTRWPGWSEGKPRPPEPPCIYGNTIERSEPHPNPQGGQRLGDSLLAVEPGNYVLLRTDGSKAVGECLQNGDQVTFENLPPLCNGDVLQYKIR